MRRMVGQSPVIVLTARGDFVERVKGLDSGADDYLGTPFVHHDYFLGLRTRALVAA
jgi:DNA-binding response OmpR family regulator